MATEKRAFTLQEAVTLARQLAANDDRVRATQVLEQILSVAPDEPNALNGLAFMRFHERRTSEAVELIERAAQVAPENAEIQINLGNIRLETGNFDGAEAACRAAARLMPDNIFPLHNLAQIKCAKREFEEAEDLLNRTLEINPDFGPAMYILGKIYAETGRSAEAVAISMKAIDYLPGNIAPVRIVTRTYARAGRIDEAIDVVRQQLARNPDDVDALIMLDSLEGRVPARSSDEYVKTTFDEFSGSFDAVLQQIEYRGPEYVAEATKVALGPDAGGLDVLDAGCGTGLVGKHLRDIAKTLIGVDLSPGMLARAQIKGMYDELIEAELTAYAAGQSDAFDLIVCADTLIYFGDLTDVSNAIAGALRSGGHFLFTVEEEAGEGADPYTFDLSGRFRHRAGYVHDMMEKTGLTIDAMERKALRREYDEPVYGFVVTARKA